MRWTFLLGFGLSLLVAPTTLRCDSSRRVSSEEAQAHLLNRVSPEFPSVAKSMRIGGRVTLRITISATGEVTSEKVITAQPIFVQSALNAVKQWKFRPFLENGLPVEVETEVTVDFPSPSPEEQRIFQQWESVVTKCQSFSKNHEYAEAEKRCREATDTSDLLPKQLVFERSTSRLFLASAIFFQQRYEESIPFYKEALSLEESLGKPNDFMLGVECASLARAYAVVGESNKADNLFAKSVQALEAAAKEEPSRKNEYSAFLAGTLIEYAKFKENAGQNDVASELRAKASALQSQPKDPH